MALSKKDYSWMGLTINPYAKITRRNPTDFREDIEVIPAVYKEVGVGDDGVVLQELVTPAVYENRKRYNHAYTVTIYTSEGKLGNIGERNFAFVSDEECTTLEENYQHLALQDEFEDWTSN